MPEHTVRDSPLVCPDCYGKAFSKNKELVEHSWLFFTKKEGVHRYDCDNCGFSYVIK